MRSKMISQHNFKMPFKYIAYLSIAALLFGGCTKDDNEDTPEDDLSNTTWIATMTDDNPGTNPPAAPGINVIYYPWRDCHMDDSFIFLKDRLTINDNGTLCENGIDLVLNTKNQNYFYDVATKKLTLGSGNEIVVLDVFELTKNSLKLGVPLSPSTNYNYMLFLFKRK
ncbi:hypothetical protein [Sphingobacterium chuzhouense]